MMRWLIIFLVGVWIFFVHFVIDGGIFGTYHDVQAYFLLISDFMWWFRAYLLWLWMFY